MIKQLQKIGFKQDPETHVWVQDKETQFAYSDGDEIEKYLLNAIKTCSDKSSYSEELTKFIKDWPTLYHLSNRRANGIRPFAKYLKGKKILEIGCGCGALSRFLGEIGADLISIEGSFRRAHITRERCKDLRNVEVVSATSDIVSGLKGFDIVILNGVLEYAPKYLGANGHLSLLKTVFNQLNKSGKLILAIENQLGIKYFAGQPEDHAGLPMYGINDSYKEGEFKTWGKKELTNFILETGFKSIQQFIPLPDYKLPFAVITPLGWKDYASELYPIAIESVLEDPQRSEYDLFSLEKAYEVTWKNDLASDTANSFLFVASKSSDSVKLVDANSLAYRFYDKDSFLGKEIYKQGTKIFERNFTIENSIQKSEPYAVNSSYWYELVRLLNRPNWTIDDIGNWANFWIQKLQEQSTKKDSRQVINIEYWDATPVQCNFWKNKLDLPKLNETKKEEIDLNLCIYHGLKKSLTRITSVSPSEKNINITRFEIIQIVLEKFTTHSIQKSDLLKLDSEEKKMNALVHKNQIANEIDLNLAFFQRTSFQDLNTRIKFSEKEIFRMTQSFSWRLTSPLRKIIRFLLRTN